MKNRKQEHKVICDNFLGLIKKNGGEVLLSSPHVVDASVVDNLVSTMSVFPALATTSHNYNKKGKHVHWGANGIWDKPALSSNLTEYQVKEKKELEEFVPKGLSSYLRLYDHSSVIVFRLASTLIFHFIFTGLTGRNGEGRTEQGVYIDIHPIPEERNIRGELQLT